MKQFCKWMLCFSFLLFVPSHLTQAAEKPTAGQSTKQKLKQPSKQKAGSAAVGAKGKTKTQSTGTADRKVKKKYSQPLSAKTGINPDDANRAQPVMHAPVSTDTEETLLTLMTSMIGFLLIPFLLITILMGVSCWKIFEKAGREGWESLVPILNMVRFLQIAKMPIWTIIFPFIPVLNIVFPLWLSYSLAKAFNKSVGYGVGLVFLPVIFYPHLAFSDASYSSDFEQSVGPTDFRTAS